MGHYKEMQRTDRSCKILTGRKASSPIHYTYCAGLFGALSGCSPGKRLSDAKVRLRHYRILQNTKISSFHSGILQNTDGKENLQLPVTIDTVSAYFECFLVLALESALAVQRFDYGTIYNWKSTVKTSHGALQSCKIPTEMKTSSSHSLYILYRLIWSDVRDWRCKDWTMDYQLTSESLL
jgi:hypothetical protein